MLGSTFCSIFMLSVEVKKSVYSYNADQFGTCMVWSTSSRGFQLLTDLTQFQSCVLIFKLDDLISSLPLLTLRAEAISPQ